MNATSQPLVSIVTPVYNEEEYLPECIESILAQTYQNWEYTIVNNCSTDRSAEVIHRYAAKDPRIRVCTNQRFLPMLENHNVAIRKISPASKYCKVALADDWIYPDCLEKMVAVAEQYPSAGIISSYQLHGREVRSAGLPYTQSFVTGRDACRNFLLNELILFGTQNSVLYRSDLVRSRDPFYVETDMCADFEACLALLQHSDLGFVHQVLTFSRIRPVSGGAISWDMGSNFVSLMDMLATYGPACLTADEFQNCLARQLSNYYQFLGRRFWVERSRAFWKYHRTALSKSSAGFSVTRLLASAIIQLIRAAGDLKQTKQRIKRIFELKKIRSSEMRCVVAGFGGRSPETEAPAGGLDNEVL